MRISTAQIAGFALILAMIAVVFVILEYQEPVETSVSKQTDVSEGDLKFPEISKNLKNMRDSSIDINNPQSCKSCHETIYNEWFNSGHREAHTKQLYRMFAFFRKDGTALI